MKRIPLTRGKSAGRKLFAIVDDEDYKPLLAMTWKAKRKSTGGDRWDAIHQFCFTPARGREASWTVRMVHLLVGRPPDGMVIDHRNGNTLDNRRSNLRLATYAQNSQNKKRHCNSRAPYKGLYARPNGTFTAVIRLKGRLTSLGTFDVAEDAAAAYNAGALKHFGEFARLNVLPVEREG